MQMGCDRGKNTAIGVIVGECSPAARASKSEAVRNQDALATRAAVATLQGREREVKRGPARCYRGGR
jgi:hypothetical protein